MIVPKGKRENLEFRAKLLGADPVTQAIAREIVRGDLLFFVNAFCWTYDPRTSQKDEPFITYDYQDEHILGLNEAIEAGENSFTDKSRDMGVTWDVLVVFFWRWLVKRNEQFLLGSEKEDKVDRIGDLSTLFEKLAYLSDRLPRYLLPQGWDKKKNRSFMRFINPETGSGIFGEATNEDFARSGRYKAALFDEFSTWDVAEEAWKSASDATPCKIVVGTPKGSANKFAELSRTPEIKRKFRLHWSLHPHKAVTSPKYLEALKIGGRLHADQDVPPGCYRDISGKIRSEWYDRECQNRSKADVAENLDIDYLTTGNPVFDTEKCALKKELAKPPAEVGELMWKVKPVFREDGMLLNWEQLEVEFVPNSNGHVKVWERPQNIFEHGYCMAADVSEGLEQGDYDSAPVLKRFDDEKPRVVADVHGKEKTFEYAETLAKLGVWYGRSVIAVERNNTMGGAVLEQLFRIYPNLYHKEIFSKGYPTRTDKLGWETTGGTKGQIIGNLSKAISLDLYEDPDEGFWSETLTFVNDDGKLEAQGKSRGQKCFDDRVMSRAILLWVNGQIPLPTRRIPKKKPEGWRKNLRSEKRGILRMTV